MTGRKIDPDDPTFKPLTLDQVLEITERSRRTVEKWVKTGKLTKYEERNRRGDVIALYREDEVLDVEHEQAAAARENRERIRRRGGRPGPRKPPSETTA